MLLKNEAYKTKSNQKGALNTNVFVVVNVKTRYIEEKDNNN